MVYKKRPTLVRWSSGNVAGSVAAKVRLFSETTILFEWNCSFEAHFYVFLAIIS